MPTYGYQCMTCKHHFERLQRFSDAPITECPECGHEVRRVIYPAGVIFKGSGWYITDSRQQPNTNSDKAESKTEGKTESTADSSASNGKGKSEATSKAEPAKADA